MADDHVASLRFTPLAAAALLLGCAAPPPAPPERIVLIVIDTLRRDHLSCYGGKTATPHIDGLAARGQLFRNAVASFHQTTMSMGALFTGRTPSLESGDPRQPLAWSSQTWCGLLRFARRGREPCIPRSLAALGETLRAAGYATIGVSSNPLLFGAAGFSRGFGDWIEVGARRGRTRAEDRRKQAAERHRLAERRSGPRVNTAVAAALDRRDADRFFLYAHYMDVHDYAMGGVSYAAAVAAADAAVGDLLELLAERALLEGAVVVLVSDHGERLGETHPVPGGPAHIGNPSFEAVLRIPLIVAPARFADDGALLRSEDVHRLLERLAGVAGEGAAESDLAPGELFLSEGYWQTYRDGRFKSTRSRADGRELLFDLEADPGERVDVAARHPRILARHRRRIDELARTLSAGGAPTGTGALSADDRARLRALGYLEE